MDEDEQDLVIEAARLEELRRLAAAFEAQDNKPPEDWITECISAVSVAQLDAKSLCDETHLLVMLAVAMWQHGYQSAPKLEFVLPEGGVR